MGDEIAQQRSASDQHDAAIDDVGCQLRRRLFETQVHGLDDVVDRLEQRFADLFAARHYDLGAVRLGKSLFPITLR